MMTTPHIGKDVEKKDRSYIADGKVKQRISFLKNETYDYHVNHGWPLWALNPKEMEIYVHAKTCIPVFRAAVIIIASNWKQQTDVLQG